jgi:sporulation protein YlmC with PRC-barrel domain
LAGTPAAAEPAGATPDRTAPVAGQDPGKAAARNAGVGTPDFARSAAEHLVGREVNTVSGDRIGTVYDALVDGRSGQVDSVIVQLGDAKRDAAGARLVEVPYQQIQIHPTGKSVVSKIARGSLDRLPTWSYEQLNNEVVAVRQR